MHTIDAASSVRDAAITRSENLTVVGIEAGRKYLIYRINNNKKKKKKKKKKNECVQITIIA